MSDSWFIPIAESEEIEQAVLDTALGIENSETREAFLRQVFAGDAVKIREMEDLVDSSRRAAGILHDAGDARAELASIATGICANTPDPDPAITEVEAEGSRIGAYLLGRKLGDGSYGEVYEATTSGDGTRRMALKIIRRGMDTAAVIARFSMERKSLALMDHPNIARVTDAGSTPRGRSYFVMDLVGPERITAYCESRGLGLRERLGLFLQVCSAIQHAHQKGIIHRDIKPSNILVSEIDGRPAPKVIDFGLAKAARNSQYGRNTLTACDDILGTPAYMSPEQVDLTGVDVDTRADIYGLGALLYELLAGRPPFDPLSLTQRGQAAMRRTILLENPEKPSLAVTRSLEGKPSYERQTQMDLRGSLDWIVAKAMEKERKRRYQTVGALMDDIERFLSHQPVRARRPSRLYVARCFLRRHRAACISSGFAVLTLIVAAVVTGILYQAERIASHRERIALSEQTRLRQVAQDEAGAAEAARKEEAHQRILVEAALAEQKRLLAETNSREALSLAAILTSMGEGDEAERLLKSYQPGTVPSLKHAAKLIRDLGSRHAAAGNWDEASRCFSLLIRAGLYYSIGENGEPSGVDLLLPGPAMIEAGDIKGYEVYREEILRRTEGLARLNVDTAQRLIKATCILPVPPTLRNRLTPIVAGLEAVMKRGEPKFEYAIPWGAFSLALYQFRSGDYRDCISWAEISRKDTGVLTAAREASLHVIMAVSLHETGEVKAAQLEMAAATALFEAGKVTHPLGQHLWKQGQPSWWDCVMARCLYREGIKRMNAK